MGEQVRLRQQCKVVIRGFVRALVPEMVDPYAVTESEWVGECVGKVGSVVGREQVRIRELEGLEGRWVGFCFDLG